jgi:Uma2 family endonuclease
MAVAKAAGTWTYEDLLALPEDGRRYEIIEGELYELPAPSLDHAMILANLVLLLGPLVRSLGGTFFFAPLDVFFQGADPVQPDILAILPGWGGELRSRGPEGAPDLVIEVLSPSNRGRDLLTKRALYGRAGVREYWIVDPAARSVEILTLHEDALHTAYASTGSGTITSPLLNSALALEAIFANVEDESAS